jgi:tetratricopeptide (TPR) repeat protein
VNAPTDPQRFARLLALVEAGKRMPLAERTAFLAREASDDAALRDEAHAVLDAEARAGSAASGGPPAPPPPRVASAAPAASPGPSRAADLEPGEPNLAAKRLGDCTLVRRLAGGGMGVVYEATQDPPGRTVAVKVLRAALAGDEGRLRFAHEARVLGRLQHPGIAQIYETGTTTGDDGEELPYFVMEHVPGARTLLEHAAAHDLTTRERLALFVRVADAVHFGHTKGVIHRDLKPGNVLVDAQGTPKVIDFGIARSTVPEADGHATPHTATGLLVGTLPYMSPEQVTGTGDVDTRSDVYALGVILYELLTGRLPYDLEGVGLVEAARRIATSPPLPPERFAPATQGDLGVILGKALAKEPSQRYASAEALSQDVQRFLAFTPIQARPPSLSYQLRLFARRHRAAFVASVIGLVALVGAVVVSAWFAAREARERVEADRQRQRAEGLLAETRKLVPWLLRDLDEEISRLPGSVTPRSRLAARLQEHLDALAVTDEDHPDVLESALEARLALGDLLGGAGGATLGRREEAAAQFTRALDLAQRRAAQPGADRRLMALRRGQLLLGRSGVRRELGDLEGATRDLDEGLAGIESLPRAGDLQVVELDLELRTKRADMEWYAGRHAAALEAYRALLERWTGPDMAQAPEATRTRGITLTHLALAQALLEMGMRERAAPHLEAVAAAARTLEAASDPSSKDLSLLYYLHDNVGRGLLEAGDLEEAEARMRAALAAAERRRARDPVDAQGRIQVHNARMLLGRVAFDARRYEQALEEYGKALGESDSLVMGEPAGSNLLWDRRLALTQMAGAEMALGRPQRAERLLARALPLAEARTKALPKDGDAFLGLRDVLAMSSNAALRRFRAALGLREHVAGAVGAAAALGAPDLSPRVAVASQRVAQGALRQARERLQRSREALLACKPLPGWSAGHERDLARTEESLAAMDEVLTELAR